MLNYYGVRGVTVFRDVCSVRERRMKRFGKCRYFDFPGVNKLFA